MGLTLRFLGGILMGILWDRDIFFLFARDLDGALELASLFYRGMGDGIRNFYTYIRSFDMIDEVRWEGCGYGYMNG